MVQSPSIGQEGIVKGPARKPIRVLPPIVVPASEDDFEEITDLLADLILEMLNRAPADQRAFQKCDDHGE